MREFKTGATRNVDEDKLDYEGFLSPLVLGRFAQYMHQNRMQADGKLRASDNWQKGIPLDSYMKSMYRHFMEVWLIHRGYEPREDLEDALCALMFNVMGMLHEELKGEVNEALSKPLATLNQRNLHSLAMATKGFKVHQFECQEIIDEEESRLP